MNRQLGRRDSYSWKPKEPRFVKNTKEKPMKIKDLFSGKKTKYITERELREYYIQYWERGSLSNVPPHIINRANNISLEELLKIPGILQGKTFKE